MDLFEFIRYCKEEGIEDKVVNEFENEVKKSLHIITFNIGKKGKELISNLKDTYVFLDVGYEDKVVAGETWICTTVIKNGHYAATPIYKLTPGLLMDLDSEIRDAAIDNLWRKNKNLFENEFYKRYKQETSENIAQDYEAKYKSKIEELTREIKELRERDERNRFIFNNTITTETGGIELFSEEKDNTGIELDSDEKREPVVKDIYVPPTIPNSRTRTMPGFPEIRFEESKPSASPDNVQFNVERTGEDTIYSESFTDPRYFVHINKDRDMLVIRPNEFGSAYSISGTITLKGLGPLSEFGGRKKLNAEFSKKYDGLVVYLR